MRLFYYSYFTEAIAINYLVSAIDSNSTSNTKVE